MSKIKTQIAELAAHLWTNRVKKNLQRKRLLCSAAVNAQSSLAMRMMCLRRSIGTLAQVHSTHDRHRARMVIFAIPLSVAAVLVRAHSTSRETTSANLIAIVTLSAPATTLSDTRGKENENENENGKRKRKGKGKGKERGRGREKERGREEAVWTQRAGGATSTRSSRRATCV
jgi:hypothetical protein